MDINIFSQDIYIERRTKLANEVKNVNGVFSFIWHNSSFASMNGWRNWEEVFSALLEVNEE